MSERPLYLKYLEEELRGLAALGTDTATFRARLAAQVDLSAPSRADLTTAFDALYTELAPPLSGVIVGATMPFGAFGIVDYLGASCSTIGEMFTRVVRYLRLLRSPAEPRMQQVGERHVIELRGAREPPAFYFEEFTAGALLGRVRELADPEFRFVGAWFSRSPTPYLAGRLAELMRCPLHFGAGFTRLELATGAMATPAMRGDPALYEALERHAESMLAELGLSEQVRLTLTQLLRRGEARISAVAEALGMNARTLQRRLQAEGLRYQAIVDAARGSLARRALAAPGRSLEEIAESLGYADVSSLSRAFHRWCGCSPAAYRERLQATRAATDQ
jgi:AraC-like DNA-binding protein